jgi:hypothetical protein
MRLSLLLPSVPPEVYPATEPRLPCRLPLVAFAAFAFFASFASWAVGSARLVMQERVPGLRIRARY